MAPTRPAAAKNALAYTLQRLSTDHVDVHRPARLDPNATSWTAPGTDAELDAVADLLTAALVSPRSTRPTG